MKVICDKLKMYIINPTANTKTFLKELEQAKNEIEWVKYNVILKKEKENPKLKANQVSIIQ